MMPVNPMTSPTFMPLSWTGEPTVRPLAFWSKIAMIWTWASLSGSAKTLLRAVLSSG